MEIEEKYKLAVEALQTIFKKEGQMWIKDLLDKLGEESDWCKLNNIDPEDLVGY